MNIKHITIIIFVSMFSLPSLADESSWTPEVNFQLENSSYKETLIWVSGVSYSLTNYQTQLLQNNKKTLFCQLPKSFGSRDLLGYLNTKHTGKKISAEQAIQTIYNSLHAAYPCK